MTEMMATTWFLTLIVWSWGARTSTTGTLWVVNTVSQILQTFQSTVEFMRIVCNIQIEIMKWPQTVTIIVQTPRQEDAEFIVEGASCIEPSVRHSTKIRDWVGLRPGRPSVRLEREMIDGISVVHNYGHGGSGITVFQVSKKLSLTLYLD